jgi:N,N'-diacetyllegionaminate synthase
MSFERDCPLFVAEIGNNHEGSIDVAKKMIAAAAQAGADAVKFQTFIPEHFSSRKDKARFERLCGFSLSFEEFRELSDCARDVGVLFVSTPLDMQSAAFLREICSFIKIASGDNTFYPLLDQVAGFGLPMIVSTGLLNLHEVIQLEQRLVPIMEASGQTGQLCFLHCVSSYPVPPEEANIKALLSMKEALTSSVGYSDHTLGIEACLAAIACGACVIEKHFTLDNNYSDFRDHKLSADPNEFQTLVRRGRMMAKVLGTGEKVPQPSEEANRVVVRRSIAAGRFLKKGHCLSFDDLTWVRPGTGVAPGQEQSFVGKIICRDVDLGHIFDENDVLGS